MRGSTSWSDDWEARRRGEGCIMCAEGRPDAIPDGLRFFAGACADAYLDRHAPTRGYSIVIWRAHRPA